MSDSSFSSKTRAAGVLLHPTSLPGTHGIGDLGKYAYDFIDFLHSSGTLYWQIMPLSPTGYGDSPYAGFSAFAGNHYLISLDMLAEDGLLPLEETNNPPAFPTDAVDYGPVIHYKTAQLYAAFTTWHEKEGHTDQAFLDFNAHAHSWLRDYCLFMAQKDLHNGQVWNTWDTDSTKTDECKKQTLFHSFLQYTFHTQWHKLRAYAHSKNIRIVGDLPIFVAYDSADVWAHPELFHLDEKGNMTVVAGVPPDYFSETGQLWGNPLYNWDNCRTENFAWWDARFSRMMELVDIIRIDHFRGFDACWHVPAQDDTAENGEWIKTPGAELFAHVKKTLGNLPVIAEDLGVITEDVEMLRKECGFPGMKILQFGFGGDANNTYLPHNYDVDTVVYTGSHDNDTTAGWYSAASPAVQDHVRRYLAIDGGDIAWDMIRACMQSVAFLCIIPMQDLLSLDSNARMNFPGKAEGNWQWRYTPEMLSSFIANRFKSLALLYGRASDKEEGTESAVS